MKAKILGAYAEKCEYCNENMSEGYLVHDGLYHYCSDECLHKDISKE